MAMQRPAPRQHMPPDARKVFSGILYDVYQWQQKRFNGEFVTFERLKRGDSVVIIPVTADGKILVAREHQPGTDWYTTVPCGGIDPGEDPVHAAARELKEETGYEPQELELWFAHQVEGRVDWALFVFIARGCTKTGEPKFDGGEELEVRGVSFEEFMRVVTQDDFQNMNIAPRLLRAALDPQEMERVRRLFGLANMS